MQARTLKELDFEFYTYIEVEYEIILNGFTTYEKPISVKKVIEVVGEPSKL